jgi:hypothetical protein
MPAIDRSWICHVDRTSPLTHSENLCQMGSKPFIPPHFIALCRNTPKLRGEVAALRLTCLTIRSSSSLELSTPYLAPVDWWRGGNAFETQGL